MDRTTIAQAALALFRTHGYDNVTVADICQACGITKPTFYRYVPSKEDIVFDVYDDITLRVSQRMLAIRNVASPWEQLVASFDMLLAGSEELGWGLMGRALIANLETDRHTFDMRPQLTAVMVATIERGQETGEIGSTARATDLYAAAAHLFEGYELMWCIRKGDMDRRDEFMRSLEALFQVHHAPAGAESLS